MACASLSVADDSGFLTIARSLSESICSYHSLTSIGDSEQNLTKERIRKHNLLRCVYYLILTLNMKVYLCFLVTVFR